MCGVILIRAHLGILHLQCATASINVSTIELLLSSSSRSIGLESSSISLRIHMDAVND